MCTDEVAGSSPVVPASNMFQLPIYQSQTNFNSLPSLNLGSQFLNFSPELAWLAVGLIGIIFLIVSFILVYHWKKFGLEKLVMTKMALSYFSVSVMLLVIMIISLKVYLNSF